MKTSKENFLLSAQMMLENRVGAKWSVEKLDEIIGVKMEDEYTDFEYGEASCYMDTAPREEIFELLSAHYLGKNWPCYSDKVDMNDFMESFWKAASADVEFVDAT